MESKISHSTQGVSFDVSADWTQENGTDLFYTADCGQIYGLNGVLPLGAYTAQGLNTPQRKLVLTFCAQAYTNAIEELDFVWYPLNLLWESLTF